MTMTEWFLAELESEAGKSRRVLEQVPTGKRAWKPHERSMEFGYLSDLVANIFGWVVRRPARSCGHPRQSAKSSRIR